VTEQTEQVAEAAQAALAEEPAPPARKPEEIEADIARARDNLADSIDVIEDKLRPANLLAGAKARVMSVVQTDDGALDPKRVAVLAGVTLLLLTYFVRRARL
jgi:Protein of unknown function (DUF3618)